MKAGDLGEAMWPRSRGGRAAILAILALAFALRVWGIDWGLPRVDLNPDELNVLQVTEGIAWDSLDPGFYNYSGLSFHLNFLAAEAARAVGVEIDPARQLLINRLWSVLWGTLTVWIVAVCGRALWNRPGPGLLAATFMAVLPLHVTDSHFGVTDIGLTFWCAVAFLLAIVAYRTAAPRAFVVGGLAVGIAIGTKFNGAVAGSAFIAAAALLAWERRLPVMRAFGWLTTAGILSLVGFFLSSPYSVLNARETVEAFLYESAHVSGGHFGFDVTADGWQYHRGLYQLVAAFPFSYGIALYLALLFGLGVFLLRAPATHRWLVLSFPVLYIGVTASWIFVPLRYYLPIAGMLLLAASWGIDRAVRARPRWGRAGVAVVLLYTLAFTVSLTARFQSDTRIEAQEWAEEHLPADARVWYGQPVFGASYMPRFPDRPDIEAGSVPLQNLRSVRGRMRRSPGNGFMVLSSLTYLRDYRQGDPEAIELWERIRDNPKRFELVRAFEDEYLNEKLYRALDPMFAGYFVSPRIEIYRAAPRPRNRRRPSGQ